MRTLVNALRLVVGIAIVIAIAAQWARSIHSPVYDFVNFFSYFTIQSNIIAFVALFVTVTASVRRGSGRGRGSRGAGSDGRAVDLFRGAATVYLATTGVVYNTLLAGGSVDSAFNVQWSNDILHRWGPLYMVLDWLLFSDRGRIAMSRIWMFLIYPLVWLVVMLVRGATDGFVPYPFLNPSLGYGVVALYCVGIAVFITLMGVVVIGMSRLRLIRV